MVSIYSLTFTSANLISRHFTTGYLTYFSCGHDLFSDQQFPQSRLHTFGHCSTGTNYYWYHSHFMFHIFSALGQDPTLWFADIAKSTK